VKGRDVSRLARLLLPLLLLASLAACDTLSDWFNDPSTIFGGKDKKPKLKGERIPVLLAEQAIKPDPQIQDLDVTVPPQTRNPDWPQFGGNPTHSMQNLSLSEAIKQSWSSSIGSGRSSANKHLAAPVTGDGRIYTMDTESVVRAFSDEGNRLWSTDLTPEGDVGHGDLGGGLAYADDAVYVTSNYGEVLALEAKTGKILWRRSVSAPTRAAPTVAGGRVFVVTGDNQLNALNAKDGTVQWTHSGLSEVTGLVGAASPAYDAGIVIVPYTSGEIYALRADNGRVLWSDTLAAIRRVDAISGLADIRGNPVIDHGQVIAVSHSGRMVAIDLRTGGRVWEDAIGGITQPWLAGNFIYVLSTENQLICLTRDDGRIRWVTQLDRWEKPEKKEDLILWTGPVLAGDKLLLAGSNAKLIAVSPAKGEIISTVDVGDPVSVPLIVANGTLYLLTDAGDLKAYR
jgi:outer membrane protein assembly factor BamB